MPAARRRKSTYRKKIHTQQGLEAFHLLGHPVWVFDIANKAMWWANESALELWNADSLEALLQRSFADDMSEATEQRLAEYLVRFQQTSDVISDQWTLYPKGKATTVGLTMSGLLIDDGRMAMLAEGVLKTTQEDIDQESLRGVEMLRHLPVAVCQFDVEGQLMYQNPEALHVFGSAYHHQHHHHPGEEEYKDEDTNHTNTSTETTSQPPPTHNPNNNLKKNSNNNNPFLSRFVDPALGQRTWEAVLSGHDLCLEAQQRTTQRGTDGWFSISLRKATDPVTSNPVILYSARDITEVMQAKRESEFFAILAHEIRTPLHQVVGFLELLSQTRLNAPQTDYVDLLQRASASLMSVINDLLDYTKIESGTFTLENIPLEVKGVVEGCQQIVAPRAQGKHLSLACHLGLGIPVQLLGDPNRLRQILLNLLQNSVKFTQTGGVTLSVRQVPPPDHDNNNNNNNNKVRLRFEVSDTGIGISPEHQKLIFQKYQQANVTIAREYGGTGLGLAICKSLVEAQNGSIELESALGQGTKISFEIPFDVPQKSTPAMEHGHDHSPTKEQNCSSHHDSNKNMPTDTTTTGLRILVAEDNKMNQKVVSAMLRRMGHIPSIAPNGANAVEQVQQQPDAFDMVLMDVQMPVMDGIDATKLIRSRGWSETRLPVVGLTASYQPAEWQYYRDSGMNDCIGKPVRMEVLRNTIGRAWERGRDNKDNRNGDRTASATTNLVSSQRSDEKRTNELELNIVPPEPVSGAVQ